ncbi:uncharacterized protein BJ212DRAFT_1296433 [Suillus subaureus]|uniref:Uncharacterized protein n=1 Tax=Suillus subaureus TaxID=48587 RepID=A0A9P7EL29_9AGAM|nr:uncharacterized protein BJ212DRAFT_1296433 [Suillus subaureus]KAG1823917.1 hypothetical protein BJ212DRAFT_1296433 [Suillus subaureus]
MSSEQTDSETQVAEVLYFTQLPVEAGIDNDDNQIWVWKDVTVISMFSLPDNDLLELSCHTSILGVVGMVPHKPTLSSGVTEDRYFMIEKPGLDIVTFGVPYKGPAAQDNQLDKQEAEAGEDDGGA